MFSVLPEGIITTAYVPGLADWAFAVGLGAEVDVEMILVGVGMAGFAVGIGSVTVGDGSAGMSVTVGIICTVSVGASVGVGERLPDGVHAATRKANKPDNTKSRLNLRFILPSRSMSNFVKLRLIFTSAWSEECEQMRWRLDGFFGGNVP